MPAIHALIAFLPRCLESAVFLNRRLCPRRNTCDDNADRTPKSPRLSTVRKFLDLILDQRLLGFFLPPAILGGILK